jgi:hypothetical protein
MDLSRDVPGYSISPHTDTRHKLVTTLFYLCNTTAWPEAGTQFLVSSEGKESAHGSGRVKWDDTMKVAKQVHIPNALHLSPLPLRFPHAPHAPANVSTAALPSRRVYRRRRRRLETFFSCRLWGTGRDKAGGLRAPRDRLDAASRMLTGAHATRRR